MVQEWLNPRNQVSGSSQSSQKIELRSTILDGEVVAIDQKGIREIPIVPEMAETGRRFLAYHLFDLLWTEGIDVIVEAFWKDEGD